MTSPVAEIIPNTQPKDDTSSNAALMAKICFWEQPPSRERYGPQLHPNFIGVFGEAAFDDAMGR